ncbi:MAG TPA: mandelate racemase/muconate lactonizing enzyme family protein [Chloroflexota bacterium]|jgi:L-alanine-DL-glutamate epimerase-like enolase superfamily enzyme|nr:mandelate racemase/muconate lactonizing enzyme family protein [Chloroflexota bacterium]
MVAGAVISAVEAIPVALPPEGAAGREVSRGLQRRQRGLVYSPWHESLFVKLTAEDGAVGWGETLASVAPEVGAAVVRTLLAPQLLGRDPLTIEALWADLYGAMRDRGHRTGFYVDALAGVDTALWDLRARRVGVPVYVMLGGPCHPSGAVPAYCGVGGSNEAEVVRQAQGVLGAGFGALKLHCTAGARQAARLARALREAVGDGVELCLDVHNTLRVDEALALGRELEGLGFRFLEAPTDPEDEAGLRTLAHGLALPIACGEGERTRWQFRDRLVAGAVDVVQPDVGYTGISELRRIAQLAEAFHVPCAPHLSAGLGVCIAAAVHTAAAMPNLYRLEHSPRSFARANSLLRRPLELRDGHYLLPQGAGLGVEPDEEALERYRLDAARPAPPGGPA